MYSVFWHVCMHASIHTCHTCGLNVGSHLRSQVLGRNITGSSSWQLDLSLARQGLLTPPTTTFQDNSWGDLNYWYNMQPFYEPWHFHLLLLPLRFFGCWKHTNMEVQSDDVLSQDIENINSYPDVNPARERGGACGSHIKQSLSTILQDPSDPSCIFYRMNASDPSLRLRSLKSYVWYIMYSHYS